MNLSIFQLLIALISIIYILNNLLRFFKREKSQSFLKVFTIIVIWTSILLISLFPSSFKSILNYFGLSGDINLIIFAGFIIVFVLIFRLLRIIEGLEKNITEIVRKEALKQIKK